MSIATPASATLDDLLQVDGKAELIGGRIVRFMPSGHAPVRAAFKIAMSLELWSQQAGQGFAYTDGIGYAIRPRLASGRESFSPDASYSLQPVPRQRMRFVDGAPIFAVEVRSQGDYGSAAEREMAAKRADYFEAGTAVVWDVDPESRQIRVYRADDPAQPVEFGLGSIADAEPAVPGWRLAVDDVFA
ncbi:MAG: Uma2 family endonuclease [Pirellulaceae bacterium]